MKKVVIAVVISLMMGGHIAHASGENIGSLSHIHAVKAHKDQIILGTHEGVYRYLDEKTVKRISTETFDVMGLAISSKRFFASGHQVKDQSFQNLLVSCLHLMVVNPGKILHSAAKLTSIPLRPSAMKSMGQIQVLANSCTPVMPVRVGLNEVQIPFLISP